MSYFKELPLRDKTAQRNRGTKAAKDRSESTELDIRLDALLGAPEDLTNYQDCIQGARRRRTQ